MRIFLAVIFLLVLSGCTDDNKGAYKRRGDARAAMFKECMELAAKMPRQADDDVADIVDQCTSGSYYMTNYIR